VTEAPISIAARNRTVLVSSDGAGVRWQSTASWWVLFGSLAFGLALLEDWGAFYNFYPTRPRVYFAVEVVLIGATLMLSPQRRVHRVFLPIPMLAFVAWWIASYAWTVFPAGFAKSNLADATTVATVIVIGGMLDRRQLSRVLLGAGLCAVGLIVAALVLLPSVAYQPASLEVGAPGLRGGFIHKTPMVACVLLFASAVFCFEHRQWLRVLCFPAVAVIVILSRSSAGLAIGMSLVGTGWLMNHGERIAATIGRGLKSLSLLSVAAGVGVIAALLGVITKLLGKDLTFSGRNQVWAGVVRQIQRKPLAGWGGTDMYALIQLEPVRSIIRPLGYVAATSHNGVLELMLRLGVVGLVLYLVVLVSTVRNGFRLLRTDPAWGRFILMMMVIVVMFAVSEVLTVLGVWFALTCLFGSKRLGGQA
jgi:exopolysaccharide production protein ExoQ